MISKLSTGFFLSKNKTVIAFANPFLSLSLSLSLSPSLSGLFF